MRSSRRTKANGKIRSQIIARALKTFDSKKDEFPFGLRCKTKLANPPPQAATHLKNLDTKKRPVRRNFARRRENNAQIGAKNVTFERNRKRLRCFGLRISTLELSRKLGGENFFSTAFFLRARVALDFDGEQHRLDIEVIGHAVDDARHRAASGVGLRGALEEHFLRVAQTLGDFEH